MDFLSQECSRVYARSMRKLDEGNPIPPRYGEGNSLQIQDFCGSVTVPYYYWFN